jgi:hypothetical protein
LIRPGDGPPVLGGAGVRPPASMPAPGGSENQARQHRDATGQPCVRVGGFARAQTVNSRIFDHMITATNNCSQLIKLKVCYYQSQSCVPVELPGYSRKEAVLGIYPALRDFRYEYTEQF